MSEKELNEEYIRDNIQGICQDCMWLDKILPIINNMLSEQYRNGLEQGKFDAMMDKLELINWLESKNNITLQQHKIVEPVIKVQEVIDKIKGSE